MSPGLEKILVASNKYFGGSSNELQFSYRLGFYGGTKRWTPFANLIDSAKNSGNGLDENVMNNYSWMVYQQCDDKEVVARATKWMSDVAEKSPKYMLLDYIRGTPLQKRRPEESKIYAETAIETGKRDKEDVQETEELLKKIMDHWKKSRSRR